MSNVEGGSGAQQIRAGLNQIIEVLRKPGGFSQLKPQQRRLLIAAILGSMIPKDGRTLDVEVNRFVQLLRSRLQFSPGEVGAALQNLNHGLSQEELQTVAKQLPELLGVEDRATIVSMLWDLAMCDKQLHPQEEKMVYQIADMLGVVRKRVAEEQARAARTHGV